MSKSIVIIDTPINCWRGKDGELLSKECPLCYDTIVCLADDDGEVDTNGLEKPKNCPLKPYTDFIPVEWIEKWVVTKFVGAGRVIDSMLDDWEKENDKNSE